MSNGPPAWVYQQRLSQAQAELSALQNAQSATAPGLKGAVLEALSQFDTRMAKLEALEHELNAVERELRDLRHQRADVTELATVRKLAPVLKRREKEAQKLLQRALTNTRLSGLRRDIKKWLDGVDDGADDGGGVE